MFFQKIRAFFEWLSAKRMKQSRKALDYPWTTHQSVHRPAEKGLEEKPETSQTLRAEKPAAKVQSEVQTAASVAETQKRKPSEASAKAAVGGETIAVAVPQKRRVGRPRKSLGVPSRTRNHFAPKRPRGTLDWGESVHDEKLTVRSSAESILEGRTLKDVRALIENEYPEVKTCAFRKAGMCQFLVQNPDAKRLLVQRLLEADAKAHQEMIDKPLRPRKQRNAKLPASLQKKVLLPTKTRKKASGSAGAASSKQAASPVSAENAPALADELQAVKQEAAQQTVDKAVQTADQKTNALSEQTQAVKQADQQLASEGKAKATAKETVRKTRSKKTEAAKPAGAARRGRKPKVQAKEDKKIVEAAAAASVVTETEKPQQ